MRFAKAEFSQTRPIENPHHAVRRYLLVAVSALAGSSLTVSATVAPDSALGMDVFPSVLGSGEAGRGVEYKED